MDEVDREGTNKKEMDRVDAQAFNAAGQTREWKQAASGQSAPRQSPRQRRIRSLRCWRAARRARTSAAVIGGRRHRTRRAAIQRGRALAR